MLSSSTSVGSPEPTKSPDPDTKAFNPFSSQHKSQKASPSQHGLLGDAHRRFVIVTTLLSLIDPVRGEPTVHSLDSHPHDGSWKHDQLLKKALDSFALICSTSRNGRETASAVCLEQGRPNGSILRLARNLGASEGLISQLHDLLRDLTLVAFKEKTVKEAEPGVLLKIVTLTQDKIWSLLEKLHDPEIHTTIRRAIFDLGDVEPSSEVARETNFRHWVTNLPVMAPLEKVSELSLVIPHIKWASEAKWIYSEQIEAMFGIGEQDLPYWLKHVYELGRYYAAAKSLLKLAVKQPGIFTGIRVEAVEAPDPERFSLRQDLTALKTILTRLTKTNPMELMNKLGQTWLTDDPEARLRKACKMVLIVHAEMQLLSFYDHNTELTPRLLFMGTSKKTCYLCHEFISRHPLTIGVSASHQKLYPTWMPAPCSSAVRKKHKILLWEFSRHLEQTTARDLETRLGIRRMMTMDSTDGPSLTTTGTFSSKSHTDELSIRSIEADDKAVSASESLEGIGETSDFGHDRIH
ncbi:hypothetical protein EV126DRAFT_423850 [Verticillium dahliae]|nr:hypothetical protein EV126DRAFT_423850 [Verticillium dahliae]